MTTTHTEASTYRWSRGSLLRLVGVVTVVLGLLWLGVGVLSGWLHAEVGGVVGGVVAALTAAALATACWLIARPPRVLSLSSAGYRIWHLRGGGVPAADWSQVQSVDSRASEGGPVILVELADGRTSIVPVSLLGSRAREAQREMHERLNSAFGYRGLRDADWSGSTADG